MDDFLKDNQDSVCLEKAAKYLSLSKLFEGRDFRQILNDIHILLKHTDSASAREDVEIPAKLIELKNLLKDFSLAQIMDTNKALDESGEEERKDPDCDG